MEEQRSFLDGAIKHFYNTIIQGYPLKTETTPLTFTSPPTKEHALDLSSLDHNLNLEVPNPNNHCNHSKTAIPQAILSFNKNNSNQG